MSCSGLSEPACPLGHPPCLGPGLPPPSKASHILHHLVVASSSPSPASPPLTSYALKLSIPQIHKAQSHLRFLHMPFPVPGYSLQVSFSRIPSQMSLPQSGLAILGKVSPNPITLYHRILCHFLQSRYHGLTIIQCNIYLVTCCRLPNQNVSLPPGMGLYLVPAIISGLAHSRCPINACSRNAVPCPQSLLAAGSSMVTCKKWVQGPHIHSSLSGHVSLCLYHRCPNSLSRSSCSPNKILAAGPRYKTDKQEGNLAEVREESRVPAPLGSPAPSVPHQAPPEISGSACPYSCPLW